MPSLFSNARVAALAVKNRLVMSPMTRNRAIGNIPNPLMAQYYAQRACVGLVIAEGTSPSPNGLGYARVLAPSAVSAAGEMYTDTEGMQPNAAPQAMTAADISTAIAEYRQAAVNAVTAGFDGVELHAANGYLLEQFIRPSSNLRTDRYGGVVENRARFVLEVADAAIGAIGKDRVGIRLSPFGVFNDMPLYAAMESDYTYLAHQLDARGLLYIHLVDHSSMGAPPVPDSIRAMLRGLSHCRLILSGGYDLRRAESDLAAGGCDLVAVARPILANPDLLRRWQTGATLNTPDPSTFYTPGPKGYIDYPALA